LELSVVGNTFVDRAITCLRCVGKNGDIRACTVCGAS